MNYKFNIYFNSEFPDIGSFELWVKDNLKETQLDRKHSLNEIVDKISQNCKILEAVESSKEVQIALLKTAFLDVLKDLRKETSSEKEDNRQKFDLAVQALFDDKNPDALSFCASVHRLLLQFRLSDTYEAREIIAEAYTRGIRKIEEGVVIDVPLAWLRRTCLNVIREFKKEQERSASPKFDQFPWVPGDLEISRLVVQEDLYTIQVAMQQLSPEEQLLLSKRVFQRLSWQEIGETLCNKDGSSLKAGTARQRGSRALKKLRLIYERIRKDIDSSEG